jgi:outer membrane immunogenic protein
MSDFEIIRFFWGIIMKKFLLASVAVVALGAPAFAADMPVKARPAPALYNWTGFYVGLNVGGAWARNSVTDSFFTGANGTGAAGPAGLISNQASGIIGGGQIGYNWQTGPVVLGIEADIDASGQSASSCVNPVATTTDCATVKVRSFGTVRGRVGYAFDRWLPYVTGGFAWQNVSASETFLAPLMAGGIAQAGANGSRTLGGYAVGGGIEAALWENWTAGVEYLYLNSGTWTQTVANFALTNGNTPSVIESVRVQNNVVRFRLNYRFGM